MFDYISLARENLNMTHEFGNILINTFMNNNYFWPINKNAKIISNSFSTVDCPFSIYTLINLE